MKLKMTEVVDKGTHASEKVLIDVLQDADLLYYILRDSTFLRENVFSNRWVHAYEFLKQPVKKGDKVVVFTKKGTDSKKDLGNGNTEYYLLLGVR